MNHRSAGRLLISTLVAFFVYVPSVSAATLGGVTMQDLMTIDGKKFKGYKGMGSIDAQKAGSSSRYFQEGVPDDRLVSHGVVAAIPAKGPAEKQINHITDTLKDAMSKYYGCRTIDEIRKGDLEFVHVHRAPPAEAPHGMVVIEDE